jgi:transposase, IS6 family
VGRADEAVEEFVRGTAGPDAIDFLLSALRDADAAKRLFRKALSDRSHPQPRVINTDLAPIYSPAIPDSKKEGTLRTRCQHQCSRCRRRPT